MVEETEKVSGEVEEDLEEARILKGNKQMELDSKVATLGIHRTWSEAREEADIEFKSIASSAESKQKKLLLGSTDVVYLCLEHAGIQQASQA